MVAMWNAAKPRTSVAPAHAKRVEPGTVARPVETEAARGLAINAAETRVTADLAANPTSNSPSALSLPLGPSL